MGRRERMQTRTITVDYARPRGYDVGYRAENNFTLLALPIPAELKDADSYRVYFESTVGEYLQTELLTPTDGYVTIKITSDIVPEPGNMAAQLVAFADGEIVGYAPMITGSAKVSIPDGTERLSHSLAAEIALNTAARHSHENKAVLDKFAESDGKPTYDGEALGGGGGTSKFVVSLEVTGDDDGYTVTSASATLEQVDAAYKAGKDMAAEYALSDVGVKIILPLFQAAEDVYVFGAYVNSQSVLAMVDTSGWTISVNATDAENVGYENESLPNVSNVKEALDSTVSKAHEHDNKSVLDKLSAADGKLKYDGSDVGLKGDKGDKGDSGAPGKDGTNGKTPVKGTDYWTAADKAEIVADTLAALPTWTGGSY